MQVAGFRVHGSGLKVPGSGFRVPGSGFRVPGSGFRIPGSGFRVLAAGFRISGPGFGFRVAEVMTSTRKVDIRLSGKRKFKLPWRKAGPPNHHDDNVDLDQ